MDNITNLYKGLDKELLDMTYPDKYYQDVIQPAKLGKGPLPSRMEMLSKFQPVKAMRIGLDPYLPSFMGGGKYAAERAKPTAAASKFLSTVGKAAKFLGTKVGPLGLLDILTPTELGSSELTEEDRQNMMKNNNMSMGIMDPNLLDEYYTSGELYDIDDTGRIPGFTDKIKGGIETMRDKLGPIGDFFSKGGVMGNVISALGKRGDESTRGIAGLNLQDVFNIDSFGSDEDPTKDPYGINIVSGFGNYNQYVKDKAKQLSVMKFTTDSAKRRKNFYEQAAAQIKAQEEKALAEALAKAQEEINRMGYQDYGSGGGLDPSLNDPVTGEYTGASTQDYGSGE